ncbi:hypothetical protein OE88DRAFT_1666835 [Heliocybe sulcata]|uniref:F-box domain-containing protein n=1 Tax=Heliocybe sulcata TaxID=5364 RepID=A0A5C3MNH6_9AGAM|nr:hypothetical protein OE88DRAFT_1666835 [Heliocybe sulcata]
MATLPIELYQEILEHVDRRRDLCSLIRVAQTLRAPAQARLYRAIEVRRHDHTDAFCRAILQATHLGALVLSLTISSDEQWRLGDLWQFQSAMPQVWYNIARALRKMPRLEVLRIKSGPHANENSWVLKECPFLLKEFQCDFTFGNELITFLRTQPRISSMSWIDPDKQRGRSERAIDQSAFLAEGDLPVLRRLVTNSTTFAVAVVPGRPITTLRVLSEAIGENLGPSIGASTGPLHCLDIVFPFHQQEATQRFLSDLVRQAPHLRTLGAIKLRRTNVRQIFDALGALRDLRTLVLWDRVDQQTLVSLEAACPSLEAIVCLFQDGMHGHFVRIPMNPIREPQLVRGRGSSPLEGPITEHVS